MREQPDLRSVAAHVNLGPYHFQGVFTQWAGVSPKKFLQYLNVEYAKRVLAQSAATVAEAPCESGLSGTARLHVKTDVAIFPSVCRIFTLQVDLYANTFVVYWI